jgi:glycolate dehydrogenase FAD-binding subunit
MGADQVLKELAAACPAARAAEPQDAIAGVPARYAATPASVAEAGALLRAAAAHDLTVVPRGGGSKLGWGTPPRRCDLVVDTSGLDQVLEHAAGDLVVRVQAGVRLARLAESLAGADQQLALDLPPGLPPQAAPGPLPGATVGGTLATAAAGPRRLRYGTPRDLVIGITVVRADGTVASSGGKVVKNVAGYDLGKLFTGSFGTLGLIVAAVFRLHPLPAAVVYVTMDCAGPEEACRAVAAAAGSDLAPTAVELDRPGRDQPVRVAVLLEGDPDATEQRARQLGTLLGDSASAQPAPPAWWGWPAGGTGQPGTATDAGAGGAAEPGTLVRIGFWAAGLARVLQVIDHAAGAAGLDPVIGGSAAAGVLYAAVRPDADPAAVAAFVSGLRGALARGEADARPASAPLPDSPPVLASAVVVHAPAAARELLDMWGPVPSLPLMRAVKDQFDPGHRMAPGRFAGGI